MIGANIRSIFFAIIIIIYVVVFSLHDQKMYARNLTLEFARPVNYYRIAAGYLQQLVAEMLFIRSSVFLGGALTRQNPPSTYAEVLGNNFEVMTKLYPRFIAPYFYAQAFLPHISLQAAVQTSTILERGIATYPNDLFLHFMYALDFSLYMNEPVKSAQAFREAAKIPKAPPLFGHLAALLSAQGGDITAGLISLRTMLSVEKDEIVKARYKKEIEIFEHTLEVQKKLNLYTEKYGVPPERLEQLVPEFLPQLPVLKDSFILVYDPPNLHLKRPDRETQPVLPK